MAVMPLVPETKMADVGKPISLENLLVRKVTWLALTTTSATLILSRDFGADYMTRIAIYTLVFQELILSILTHWYNTHSYTETFFVTVTYESGFVFGFPTTK